MAFNRLRTALRLRLYRQCCQWLDRCAMDQFVRLVHCEDRPHLIRHPNYLVNPQYMKIGRGLIAHAGFRLEAWDSYRGQQFKPQITIGDNVCFNFDVHIGAVGKLDIGSNVLVGSRVLITDHSHGRVDFDSLQIPAMQRPLTSKGPTIIEDNVWIGEGACILGGVRVGKNSVIGCNAVVTRDVPPDTVVGGVPAKPLRVQVPQPAAHIP